MNMRLGEPHVHTEQAVEHIVFLHLPGIETPVLGPPVRSPVTVPPTLIRLPLNLHTFGLDVHVCIKLSTGAVSRTVGPDETILLNSRLLFRLAMCENFA
jgi:hypothetical protein